MTTVTQYWAPHDNRNGLYQARGQLIWSWPQVELWSAGALCSLAAGFFADLPIG